MNDPLLSAALAAASQCASQRPPFPGTAAPGPEPEQTPAPPGPPDLFSPVATSPTPEPRATPPATATSAGATPGPSPAAPADPAQGIPADSPAYWPSPAAHLYYPPTSAKAAHDALLNHLMGQARRANCCHAPAGRYCAIGVSLRQSYRAADPSPTNPEPGNR
ncbi:MAG: hypothetical protein H7842_14185 [Gammaproteobacteria bacterium SHHR-1]